MANERVQISESAISEGQKKAELAKVCCKRCGHCWCLRRAKLPKICPCCKSPYWNKVRGWAAKLPRGKFKGGKPQVET